MDNVKVFFLTSFNFSLVFCLLNTFFFIFMLLKVIFMKSPKKKQ